MKKQSILVLLIALCLSSVASATIVHQDWNTGVTGSRQAIVDFLVDLVNPVPVPDEEEILNESLLPDASGKDNYVAKFYGWVTVPESGDYQFHYSCDDFGMLYVSQDEEMANAVEVAWVDGWAAVGEWDKYPTQHSEVMSLHAGQTMAVMAFFQEAGGGDNMDMGWTGPGLSSDITAPTYLTDYITHIPPTPTKAKNPVPTVDAIDISRDAPLAWDAGKFAAKHNIYLGTSLNDVNDATAANPMGVLAKAGNTATTFDPGILEFGQTYYWRVDEVNAPPTNTIYTGKIWSFTVEPLAIPVESITATASAANENMGPENTLNGLGLDAMDQHSVEPLDMWLAPGADTWIQYDFDKPYKLHELIVWNSNQPIEAFLGFGVKEITIEYTADGENWTALDGPVAVAKAPGLPTYTGNEGIALGGVMATAVKLTVVSAHGFTGQSGLSAVRFLAIPVAPRTPQPADGGTSDGVEIALSWRSGREAVSHEVSLGADADSLTQIGTTGDASMATDTLDYNTSYAWSVTEVNNAADPTTHAGDVWTFTTPEYGTVDDFESYSGDEGQEVFMTWFDGFGGDASLGGSTTGHIDGPFVETAIVNPGTGGSKSMPVYIDNDGGFFDIDGRSSSPNFSEVLSELSPALDMTASNIKTLSIMFAGSAGLTGQLYCKIGSTKLLYDGDAGNLSSTGWQAWNIDLSTVGGNLTNVRELSIGVEGGTSGVLYIDDIRLYTQIGEYITPSEPTAGLVAHYAFENNANDVSGNGHNGTVNGSAMFAAGQIGSALDCDGIDSYVSTGKSAAQLGIDGNKARTVSSWVYTRAYNNGGIYDVGARTDTQDFCLRTMATENVWRIQYWGGDSDFTLDTVNKWVHFTHVHDGERTKIYADGMLIVDWEKTVDTSNTNPFQIGCYGWQNDYFNGLIDEVRVYNRAVTAGEALWLAGKTQPAHKPF